ncbi:MAG: hypothetical protein GX275_00925 [Clostridiales bacterium]|nr:hypothetical protein [Clostridiales bacterium]
MKNLYNKALLYQSLYLTKWFLAASSLLFGLIVYSSMKTDIFLLQNKISYLDSSDILISYSSFGIYELFILGGAYMISTGINRRNSLTFLLSEPYTKEEIKRNELQVLFISLACILFVFLYVSMIIFFNNKNIISICTNYYNSLFIVFFRLVVVGSVFILYLSIMDMLFSNKYLTAVCMVALPLFVIYMVSIYEGFYMNLCNTVSYSKLNYFINKTLELLFSDNIELSSLSEYKYSIVFIIICIFIMIILNKYINKKITINDMNKLFSFKIVEKTTYFSIAFAIISTVEFLLLSKINYLEYDKSIGEFNNFISITILLVLIFINCIISYVISNKLRKRINKIF